MKWRKSDGLYLVYLCFAANDFQFLWLSATVGDLRAVSNHQQWLLDFSGLKFLLWRFGLEGPSILAYPRPFLDLFRGSQADREDHSLQPSPLAVAFSPIINLFPILLRTVLALFQGAYGLFFEKIFKEGLRSLKSAIVRIENAIIC